MDGASRNFRSRLTEATPVYTAVREAAALLGARRIADQVNDLLALRALCSCPCPVADVAFERESYYPGRAMSLKDLLVYVDQTERAFVRLRLAADLARRHASLLTALFVREWNPAQLSQRKAAELGLATAKLTLNQLDHAVEESIDKAVERLRSALESLGSDRSLETRFHCVDGSASAMVPQHARYADLCILGQDASSEAESMEYTLAEQALFVTGRPVLFVPACGSFDTLGRHIVVAWN